MKVALAIYAVIYGEEGVAHPSRKTKSSRTSRPPRYERARRSHLQMTLKSLTTDVVPDACHAELVAMLGSPQDSTLPVR